MSDNILREMIRNECIRKRLEGTPIILLTIKWERIKWDGLRICNVG